MAKLLLATNNHGKLKEFLALLDDSSIELMIPSQLRLELSVDESGDTYAENAALKARAFANASGLLTLADDSGLEVDALGGQPGIRSARYSTRPGAGDADRRAYLLEKLAGRSGPWTARFRCVIAIAKPEGEIFFAEGVCPGQIILEERGEQGFGYDPIFLLPELGMTMAELPMAEKNRISHRARAVQAAIPILNSLLTKS
ncbi:MAG TPA: RdgB/HAM1 family non-canonical purine NTP pyrophosphatase [Anaerolineales bacterium]|nr:RdgB/HAM1 family non-canonical purine NTP pyrophosphatase [Anaerolineales bacterium]